MADVNANIGVNIDASGALAQLKALQKEIGRFHRSVATSSESAALAQRDLQKNFVNGINSVRGFSAQLTTVKTSAEAFTDSLENNKFSMREYFRYSMGATKLFGKLFSSELDSVNRAAYDNVKRLSTQYIQMGRDANGAMRAIAITPQKLDLSNATVQMQLAAQKQAILNQLLKQGSTNLVNFGKNTQWAGRQLMVGFTIPLMMLGSTAARVFMDMEAAALKFRKVYGDLLTPQAETQQALEDIQALASNFTRYGIAASQTVSLAADAAAAGFKGIDLQRQVTEATRLQVLGQIDQQKALDTTISLQNAFKMQSEELAGAINFLNAVENQTVVSLDDITTAIPKVGPIVKQLGGDVKDLAYFMAAMREGGVQAGEGANALKTGLARLISPTKKAKETLASMGIDIDKIVNKNAGNLRGTLTDVSNALKGFSGLAKQRAIKELFGIQQQSRLTALFTNLVSEGSQASRVLDLTNASAEDLAATAEKELGMTADSAMNKFRKTVEDLKIALVPIGQTFLEVATPILEWVGDIIERFDNLSPSVKKAITILTVAIAGFGPVALMTFGLIGNALGNTIKLFSLIRIGLLRLKGGPKVLGTEVSFLTKEQQIAAAAAESLGLSHAKLRQEFGVEAVAVRNLVVEYQKMIAAQDLAAKRVPGMMAAGFTVNKKTKKTTPKKRAKGKPAVVGGTGNQDTELSLLTPGETVVPADMSKKYAPVINAMIEDNIPGFAKGKKPQPRDAKGRFTKAKPGIRERISGIAKRPGSALGAALPLAFLPGKAGDIAGNLLQVAAAADLLKLAFKLPIPHVKLLAGTILGTIGVIKASNTLREKERKSIEGLADAATLTEKKLKTLGGFFGVATTKSVFSSNQSSTYTTPQQRSQIDKLRASKRFKKDFKDTIEDLKTSTDKEAELLFKSLSVQLKGEGFATEQIQTIIDALREEGKKTDVVIDVKSLNLKTKEGQAELEKSVNDIIGQVSKAYSKGFEKKQVRMQGRGPDGQFYNYLADRMVRTKDFEKQIKSSGQELGNIVKGISDQFNNGIISAEEYDKAMLGVSTALQRLSNIDPALAMDTFRGIIKLLPEDVQKVFDKVTNLKDAMYLLNLQSLGLGSDLAGVADALKIVSNPLSDITDRIKAEIRLNLKNKEVEDARKLIKSLYGDDDGITPGPNGDKKLTFFDKELAMLNKKRDALKDVNDELKRQNDYQQKQMDLMNQAAQAKISGNYLQAAMLGQQSLNLGAEYAKESQQLQMDKVIKITSSAREAALKRKKMSAADFKLQENIKTGNYGAISPLAKTPNTGLNYPTGGVVYNINANVSGVQDPQKAADIATTQVLRKLTLMDNKNNKSNRVAL